MTYTVYASEVDPPRHLGNAPGWTDERIEILKKLYAKGFSCSKIADELGHVSRNGVIGKVHRLGLERRGNGGNYNANQWKKPGPKPRPHIAKPVPAFRPKVQHASPELKALRCAEIEPRHLTVLELEHGQCRYPYGDDVITFCGHVAENGLSYCAPHQALTRLPTKGLSQ